MSTVGATKYPGPGDRRSAEHGADALGAGAVEEAADAVEVRLGNERSDLDVVTGAGFAHDQRADLGDKVIGELRGDRFVYQHPATGTAFLPGVPIPGGAQRARRGSQIGVVEHDHRGLAAELEVNPLECRRSVAGHCLTAVHRAGQSDHVELRVRGEPVTDHLTVAGDDIENPGGQQVGDEFGELQRGQRRLFGWLEHRTLPAARIGAIFQAAMSNG